MPALLQTKAFALAIERYGPLRLTDAQIVERVDVRMARAGVLDRQPEPLQYTCFITEYVLTSIVGGRDVMVEQLEHLLDLGQRPNVELRLLPADGRDACAPGGFELLTRTGGNVPFMVVSFDVDAPRYVERPEVVRIFTATYDYLASVALTTTETARRIRDIQGTHR